ncbi:DUF58 domain-containing protein [Candidatus Uabimicrobium sp. HlEnr_7]|uniref:DUF58 domain-containing protein n=1 Tax=Candidatus Uabimicrobium helgolandensis TaxID=3095367 RepID=UPI00355600C4
MVNPKPYQLDSPEFAKQLNILCLKAKKRKKQQKLPINWQGKETFEFEEYRKYNPGDDLRRVDWNIFQRLQEIVVKEYEIDPPKHLVIALDVSASMDSFNKLAFAKAVVAALTYIGTALIDKVSFFCFPYEKNTPLQSFSTNHNILQFFHRLQNISSKETLVSFEECFSQLRLLNSANINTVVISDFYTKEYFRSLRLFRGVCTAVQIVSKEEFYPQMNGSVCLKDVENKIQHSLFVDKKRLEIYQKNLNNHLSQVKSHCLQHKINYLLTKNYDLTLVLNILQLAGFIR